MSSYTTLQDNAWDSIAVYTFWGGYTTNRQFWLDRGVDKLTEVLLCLPNIAESMATTAGNADDAQGWLYLQSMFEHWFSGKSNSAGSNSEPFWVDWDWAMRFKRASYTYAMFIDPSSQESPHIANAAALQQLGRILQRNGYLTDQPQDFDFINTPWTQWEDKYHTLTAVSRGVDADGLYTAMGAFTLRALAKGHVSPNGKGGHTILVREIAVFVHDRFQFEQDTFAPNNNLGFWSCAEHDGGLFFKPPVNAESYFSLDNETFRVFRNAFGNGGDFPVLSMPRMVEHFKGLRYDYA